MSAHISKFCIESNVEYKAIEVDGKKEHHVSGFVSAPYLDKDNDFIPEHLQPQIVDRINKGFANRASLNHDFLIEGNLLPLGAGKAELKVHPKLGMKAAWVDVVLDEQSPKFPEFLEKATKGELKGFSIEYTKNPKHHFEDIGGKTARVFEEVPMFGFGVITSPFDQRNPMATADGGYEYKAYLKQEQGENMAETQTEKLNHEVKAEIDYAKLGRETHERMEQDKKMAEMKAMLQDQIKAELKAVKSKEPYINPTAKFFGQESTPFDAELKGWRDAMKDPNVDLNAKYDAAGKLHTALSRYGINHRSSMESGSSSWKSKSVAIGVGNAGQKFELKGFEYKAQLEHDTNKVSDTDYYQNAAELNDVYQPVILDHLNQKTTYYGMLRKIDASNIGSDRYGFKIRTGRIAGAGGDTNTYNYDEGATLTGQNSTKIKVQAPFMQYGVVLQVSGFMEAMSRGSIGSAFSKEVMLGTADLLKGINVDLFGTAVGFTAGGKVTGLQVFGDDGGTYTALYGHARGTFTTLQGNLRAQSGSPNVTKVMLRQILRDCEIDGADRNQLAFVMHPIQRDKVLGLLDAAQRFNNNSARAGFEGLPMFDGVPIFSDVDATNTLVHVVPMDGTYLSVLQAPTFEDLAKSDDSKKGFVKTYFAHVMEQPNHGGIITGLSNS